MVANKERQNEQNLQSFLETTSEGEVLGVPPCTEVLKEALFACLRSHLPNSVELTDMHPLTLADVSLQGGRVVISDIDNRTISRQVVTSCASSPALQFAAYHQSGTVAGRLMKQVDAIIKLKCCCVNMDGQKLDHVQRRQWLPIRFIEQTSLFVGACVFEFFMQRG